MSGNVDVAALKSEFLYHQKKANGFSLRNVFTNNAKLNKLGSIFPALTNFMVNQPLVKKRMGVASKKSAIIGPKNISENGLKLTNQNGTTSFVNGYLFCDEFHYYDFSGIDALNY
jgi:hypothetical protein